MRAFWWLTGATAVSTAGNTFLYLAVPWALVDTTSSGLLAVLAMAALNAPYLAAPFLGAIIDRYDRRILFVAGEVVQGTSVALIPVLLAFGQVGLVFVALGVVGLARVVSDVAGGYGLIPALVPRARLDQAASWFNTSQLVARFAGPALAGVTIGAVGTTWALLIDAATFLLTCFTVFFMPKVPTGTSGTSLLAMLRAGVAYFRTRPDLQRLTFALALYNLGAGALEPTLLTVGATQWLWSATAMGVAVSAGAVAAAVGAAVSPLVRAASDRQRRIAVWLAVAALGSFGLLISTPLAVVLGFCVLCFGEGGINATTMAYRQHEIPSELSGRVNSVIRMFVTGAVSVSALLLGLTVNLSGSLQVFFPVTVTAVLAVVVWHIRTTKTVAAPTPDLVAVGDERSVS